MNWPPSPAVRLWTYGVITAGVPLLISYGALTESQAPLWLALAASVLGTGMAAFNVPTNKTEK